MRVLYTRQFNKDISSLRDKKLAHRLEKIIDDVGTAKKISEIPNLKKLSGFKNAYRVRLGDYRIGIFMEDDLFIFAAFQHRKEIYKNFP